MVEEKKIEVKLIPRPEEIPIICGLTKADECIEKEE